MASAHITLGVKEPPLNELLVTPVPSPYHEGPDLLPRAHLMFSHTIKGQLYNMELLSKFLTSESGAKPPARLIDFELLTNEDGKRTVGFGWYAGGKHISYPQNEGLYVDVVTSSCIAIFPIQTHSIQNTSFTILHANHILIQSLVH